MALALLLCLAGDDWDEILRGLRDGIRADNPAFQKVKERGPAAYPRLIDAIDHKDLTIGRAAVRALVQLTGTESALPAEGTQDMLKASWERTHGQGRRIAEVLRMRRSMLSEAEFRSAFDALSDDDPGVRDDALSKVREGILRHAAVFRRLFEAERDTEALARAGPLLAELPEWEAEERRVRIRLELSQAAVSGP